MTEIPKSGSESHRQLPSIRRTSDCSRRGALICVVLIIGTMVSGNVFVSSFRGPSKTDSGATSYDSMSIVSYTNTDITPYITGMMHDEFNVNSSQVQTSTPPDMWFNITVISTGVDNVMVSILVAVYRLDLDAFNSIPRWDIRDSYLVQQGLYTNTATNFFNLDNQVSTYVWAVWFNVSHKTVVWDVDITINLRYNWHS
ncbi:MAG: hypothetical protein ACFFAZ_11140 [Promethearchaeota archaeon]